MRLGATWLGPARAGLRSSWAAVTPRAPRRSGRQRLRRADECGAVISIAHLVLPLQPKAALTAAYRLRPISNRLTSLLLSSLPAADWARKKVLGLLISPPRPTPPSLGLRRAQRRRRARSALCTALPCVMAAEVFPNAEFFDSERFSDVDIVLFDGSEPSSRKRARSEAGDGAAGIAGATPAAPAAASPNGSGSGAGVAAAPDDTVDAVTADNAAVASAAGAAGAAAEAGGPAPAGDAAAETTALVMMPGHRVVLATCKVLAAQVSHKRLHAPACSSMHACSSPCSPMRPHAAPCSPHAAKRTLVPS